ncbi:Hypothetical_protein [Hexamita inflata]|uniref:Hypothetical_protein n=1 Tax=Hexamita inflata TaxID=28002 RepID=A0AA86NMR1_9EUKA|nr:Hypothetical protein HINF_LOCUS9501 [Hexamita inflata]
MQPYRSYSQTKLTIYLDNKCTYDNNILIQIFISFYLNRQLNQFKNYNIICQLIEKLWETNTHHICSTEQHFHPAFKGETSGREQRKGPRPKRRRPTRGARSALGRSWGISILLFIFPFIVLDFTLLCQCEIVPRRRVVRSLSPCSPSSSITFLLLSAASQRRFRKALVGKPEKSDSDTARAQTLPRSCDQISLQVPTEHLVDEKCVSKRKARTRATY